MSFDLPEASKGDFQLPPEGTHLAVCYQVIDLGTQETNFKGQIKKQHKILIGWELSDELMDDGRPFIINQRYTYSMFEKATLRQHLEAWRGRKFDDEELGPNGSFKMENIVRKPCLITVTYDKERKYANVTGVAKLMKGMSAPEPVNQVRIFHLKELHPTEFQELPEWMQLVIKKSPEYQNAIRDWDARNGVSDAAQEENGNQLNDEIPF